LPMKKDSLFAFLAVIQVITNSRIVYPRKQRKINEGDKGWPING